MGMRNNNIAMKTKVRRVDLLKKLRDNLETHAKIVVEARDGYAKKAEKALLSRLEELKAGLKDGKVVSLSFTLSPPLDYSEVYRSTIKMLEWNTEDIVELEADEFRQLVEDKWDWTNQFLNTNAAYSGTAAYFGSLQAQWEGL